MWFRRRKYINDPKLQGAVAAYVVGSLFFVAANYVVALLVFGVNAYVPQSGAEVRGLMIQMSVVFASLAAIHMVVLAIVLTHRVVGPMQVLEKALKGMRKGDYSKRMTLRKRDYLKSLSAEIQKLSLHMQEKLGDVDRCLGEKDYEAAREIVARLRGESEPELELVPESETATATATATESESATASESDRALELVPESARTD